MAIGHLYFGSIHPFEDGNGRIGRALAEKSLAQNIGQPSLILLAVTIECDRKAYYSELERHQRKLDIAGWIICFSETVLEAQQATIDRIHRERRQRLTFRNLLRSAHWLAPESGDTHDTSYSFKTDQHFKTSPA